MLFTAALVIAMYASLSVRPPPPMGDTWAEDRRITPSEKLQLNEMLGRICLEKDACDIKKVHGHSMYSVLVKTWREVVFFAPVSKTVDGIELTTDASMLFTRSGAVRNKQNISQRIVNDYITNLAVDTSLFGEEDAIVMKPKGVQKGSIILFTDPDCPYCRRFEEKVAPQLLSNGISIKTILFPLVNLHPEAYSKAKAIWCSPNKESAI